MNRLITHISRWPVSEWIVLKLDLDQQGQFMASWMMGEKKKGTLSLHTGKNDVPSGSLKEALELARKPVILILDGKGVLHKKYHTTSGRINPSNILPNVSIKEFFIQQYAINDEEGYISVIRKKNLDAIHGFFSEAGSFVVKTYLGPLMMDSILEETGSQETYVFDYKLTVRESKITELEKIETVPSMAYELPVGTLNAEEIGLYAALDAYLGDRDGTTFLVDDPPDDNNAYVFKELVQKSMYAWIILLFTVLLVNYLFYSMNQSKIEALESEKFRYQTELSKRNDLQQEFELKNDVFTRSGFDKTSAVSLMIDEILTHLPYGVDLLQLDVFPVQNRVKPYEEIQTASDQMLVEGVTPESSLVNTWIKRMDALQWIREIRLIDYRLNEDNNGQFTLEIECDLNNVLE